MTDKVYLGMPDNAAGDCIMFCDVVKFINSLCPDTNVCVVNPSEMLVTLLGITGCTFMVELHPGKDSYCPHVMYTRGEGQGTDNIIRSMYDCVRSSIPSLPALPAKVSLCRCLLESAFKTPEEQYVIVPSFEPVKPQSRHKGNNYELMDTVVHILAANGINVYELNTWSSHPKFYPDSKDILYTRSFVDSAKILKNAALCITYENGLMHWACHNSGNVLCLFTSTSSSTDRNRVFYPNMSRFDVTHETTPIDICRSAVGLLRT